MLASCVMLNSDATDRLAQVEKVKAGLALLTCNCVYTPCHKVCPLFCLWHLSEQQ